MSVTSGFFDSLNGDRRYNAAQFSAMFDNLITDGVFVNVGTAFEVKAGTGNGVTVGVGRAWFNSAWVYNDALYSLTAQTSEMLLDRIDAVVIEINHNDAVRSGSIRIVQGSPSSDPVRPVMTNTEEVHQHPLAYIYRKGGSTSITQADITNVIGTSECPYVTGILETQDIDKIVAQWQGEFDNWFDSLDVILEGDVAANLANQVLSLQSQFHSLAKDRCVYEDLQDSTGDTILDSSGAVVEGTTSFDYSGSVTNIYVSGGGGGGDPVTPPSDPGTIDSVFVVGDTLTTVRTNLGDKWLLCNGGTVDRTEYSELSSNFPAYPSMEFTSNTLHTNSGYAIAGVHSICYGNGYYVAISYYGAEDESRLFYATDLNGPWTEADVTPASAISVTDSVGQLPHFKMIFADEHFIIMANNKLSYAALPTDTWTVKEFSYEIGDILYHDGKIIVVSCDDEKTAVSYASHVTGPWTESELTNQGFHSYSIINDGTQYIIVGFLNSTRSECRIMTSESLDNSTWDMSDVLITNTGGTSTDNYNGSIAHSTDGMYAMGFNGTLYYSRNLMSGWTELEISITEYTSAFIDKVIFINGLWMFLGSARNEWQEESYLGWILNFETPVYDMNTIHSIHYENANYVWFSDMQFLENKYYVLGGQAGNKLVVDFAEVSTLKLPEISLGDTIYTYIKAKS